MGFPVVVSAARRPLVEHPGRWLGRCAPAGLWCVGGVVVWVWVGVGYAVARGGLRLRVDGVDGG